MIIREAKAEESNLIQALRLQAYGEHATKIPEAHWAVLKSSILADEEQIEGLHQIVAELDGEIVGAVVLFPAKVTAYEGVEEGQPYPELRKLAISPNVRGKGVGSALIQECKNRAKQDGHTEMGLHTADFMTDAMSLYTHLGFERIPELDFEPADDGIIVKAFKITV